MADSTPLLSNARRGLRSAGTSRWVKLTKRELVVFAGPLAMVLVLSFVKIDEGPKASQMLGALVWLALWWMMEPVPICITALLPLVLFPFLKIMDADKVAGEYANDTVTLMLGTFILALAIERFNLHKRIALRILLFFGGRNMDPRLVLLGFCAGPAFVSMWMSNTAACVMMIPMATGVLKHFQVEDKDPALCKQCSRTYSQKHVSQDGDDIMDPEEMKQRRSTSADNIAKQRFSKGVILAIVYGTAIGGLATITGCGPNLVLPGIYSERFPNAKQITYFQWMLFAVPLAVPFLIFLWLMLCWLFCPASSVGTLEASFSREMVEHDYEHLGPMSFAEGFVASSFVVLVVLWCTRTLGNHPGWSELLGGFPNEGTVSIMVAILFFIVPSRVEEGQKLMDWATCKKLPWDVMLLLGGGFALSAGIQESGLSTWLGNHMQILHSVPYFLLTPVVALIVNFTTEFASNAATATLFLPLVAELAVSIGQHPLLLMIPATFSCNYSFILPIASPPNAIAHSTGYIKPFDMVLPGFLLKVVGIAFLTVLIPTLVLGCLTSMTPLQTSLGEVYFQNRKM